MYTPKCTTKQRMASHLPSVRQGLSQAALLWAGPALLSCEDSLWLHVGMNEHTAHPNAEARV